MKTKALLFIILAGITWGTSPLFVAFLKDYNITSLQMTATRSFVSVLVLGIFVLIKDRALFKVRLSDLLIFFISGIGYVGTATFYYQAMQMTSAATSVVLMYTAPIYVTVFSVAFLGERMTKLKLTSILIMLAGCVLVAGVVGGFKMDLLGILFGVLSGISYSVYNIFTKIAMRRGANPLSNTFYAFLFAAVIAIAICNPVDFVSNVSTDALKLVPYLIFFGAVTCVVPYFFYTLAMRDLSAGTACSLGIIEPMAASIFSAVFLSEIPDVFQIIGIVLILGATVLLSRSESEINKEEL